MCCVFTFIIIHILTVNPSFLILSELVLSFKLAREDVSCWMCSNYPCMHIKYMTAFVIAMLTIYGLFGC